MARRRAGRRTFGAVRRLPSGRWQASYKGPDGTRRVGPTTFVTVADANGWLRTVETALSEGTWRPPELAQETFGDYGDRWLANRTDLRPRSAELYALLWRRWLKPDLGSTTLGSMTPETWRAWVARMTTEHPGSTQPAKAYRLARAMLNTAVEDGLLRVNPCRVKGAGKERCSERPVVMPAQVAAIVGAIDKPYQAMVLLGAYCSLRFGELAGLRRKRVDLLHRTVTVEEQAVELSGGQVIFGPPKSEAGRRVVAIPAELVPVIEAHLADHVDADADALLFTSPEGHPLRRTKFGPRWEQACRSVGITGLHFHDLRGSGATWAATAGATVAELMARLGHSTPTMAMRYQHATLERDREIADRLGALLRLADAQPTAPAGVVGVP